MNQAGASWIASFDTGGTSTKAALYNRNGELVADHLAEGFNLRSDRVARLQNIVVETLQQLFHDAHLSGHSPAALSLGVAGAGREEDRQSVREVLGERFPQSLVLVHHDAYTAHWGAFEGEPGVLLTSGTGSIAFGRNGKGEEARAGGWGWLLGDEGSGWWIGREAVRSALAADEGSGPATGLTELIVEHFGLGQPFDVIRHVYSEQFDRSEISSLAEGVSELARQGDEIARWILTRAGHELGGLASAAGLKLQMEPEQMNVALLGSVGLGGGEWLQAGVVEKLAGYPALYEQFHGSGEVDIQLAHGAPPAAPMTESDGSAAEGENEKQARSEAGESGLPAPDAADEERTPEGEQVRQAGHEIAWPQYPPRDLTLDNDQPGPRLIEAKGNALDGACRWAIEELARRMFA